MATQPAAHFGISSTSSQYLPIHIIPRQPYVTPLQDTITVGGGGLRLALVLLALVGSCGAADFPETCPRVSDKVLSATCSTCSTLTSGQLCVGNAPTCACVKSTTSANGVTGDLALLVLFDTATTARLKASTAPAYATRAGPIDADAEADTNARMSSDQVTHVGSLELESTTTTVCVFFIFL